MRIIAGEAKNRIIKTRKGFDTRPTLESVKESLFSIIAPYVENSVFLDLFSGSGSISLEAVSRGAKRAVMIEKDGEALKYIIENRNELAPDALIEALASLPVTETFYHTVKYTDTGFVLAGNLMNFGGITERLIKFCNKLVGHITGGLAIANVVASMLFAGISGHSVKA